jgi:hypothetical protein
MRQEMPTWLAGVLGLVEVDIRDLRATVADESLTADSAVQLRQMLANAIYARLHVGSVPDTSRPKKLRDLAVEEILLAATPHAETFARCAGSRVGQQWIGVLGGVRVRLPDHAVRPDPAGSSGEDLLVTLPASRAALSPGFFLADSTAGPLGGGPMLRVYVSLATVAHAEQVWRAGLRLLEDRGARYRAKVCSAPALLPRRDGMVVYLGPDTWSVVPSFAAAVSGVCASERGVSVFAKEVSPGVSIAWEPNDPRPGMRRLSFGEHRALALSDGLLDWARDGASSDRRASFVMASLKHANVDHRAPFRNVNSPDEASFDEIDNIYNNRRLDTVSVTSSSAPRTPEAVAH